MFGRRFVMDRDKSSVGISLKIRRPDRVVFSFVCIFLPFSCLVACRCLVVDLRSMSCTCRSGYVTILDGTSCIRPCILPLFSSSQTFHSQLGVVPVTSRLDSTNKSLYHNSSHAPRPHVAHITAITHKTLPAPLHFYLPSCLLAATRF